MTDFAQFLCGHNNYRVTGVASDGDKYDQALDNYEIVLRETKIWRNSKQTGKTYVFTPMIMTCLTCGKVSHI